MNILHKLRRFLTLFGVGIAVLSLTACSIKQAQNTGIDIDSSESEEIINLGPDLTGKDFSGYRVGVSLADCTSNTYCASYVLAMNDAMAGYGVDTSVFDAFGDSGQQAAQINTLLSMDVDLIILWPVNSDSAVGLVKSINEAGIPVIMANTNVSPDGEQYVEGFIGPSGVDEASQTALRMLEDLHSKGSIVVMNGADSYAPAQERQKGLHTAIAGTKINIAEEYNNCDQRKTAREKMTECLNSHPIGEIDALFCYDDEAALGAFEAMRELNRTGEIRVYISASGNYDIMSYIEEGQVSATAIQSPIVDARTMVNYSLSFLLGEPLPDFYNYINTPVVTAENVGTLTLTPWS